MFNKEEKNTREGDTIIGVSVKVKGDFVGDGNLIIDGQFSGLISTGGSIFAGDKSIIDANVIANDAKILGSLTGNITVVGGVEIGPAATISGDITAATISINKGAVVNGLIKTVDQKEA